MTFLAAAIWNQIAKEQPLETAAANVAFRLNPDQLAKICDIWWKMEIQAGTSERVASRLSDCLPILAEYEALAEFQRNRPELRNAMPEIYSVDDAVELMRLDWRLDPAECVQLKEALQSPETLERWHQAALIASREA